MDKEGKPNGAESKSEWPEPVPFDVLPKVDAFDLKLLPEGLHEYVEDIAERMQVPLDYPAACAMVCLAGAVNRRATIQPKTRDTGWIVTPNLWGGIVGPPGFLKSPALNAVAGPLYALESSWQQMYEGELELYEANAEQDELKLSAWKELVKRSFKNKQTPPPRPDTSAVAPVRRRLITSDSTFEKLHELLRTNPDGLLLVRDELSGWWSELDREGRQGDRAFFLSAWNGDSPFVMDRIGRGTIFVPACCVSMLGCVTPARLRSYLTDALEGGPLNDGLVQRFQLLVWPDAPRNWRYIDTPPKHNEAASQLFQRLASWSCTSPRWFQFDAEAQKFFVWWIGSLENKIRSCELDAAVVSHLSKYRSLLPSLALLLQAARPPAEGDESRGVTEIPLRVIHQAAGWCSYLESHAKRTYSCVVSAEMHAAGSLAEKLKHKTVEFKDDGVFHSRDIYRRHWTGLDTPEKVKPALEILADYKWARPLAAPDGLGRPPDIWMANPRIWE